MPGVVCAGNGLEIEIAIATGDRVNESLTTAAMKKIPRSLGGAVRASVPLLIRIVDDGSSFAH